LSPRRCWPRRSFVKIFDADKTRMIGLPCGEKKLWQYVKPFSSDTGTSRTDKIAISTSRVKCPYFYYNSNFIPFSGCFYHTGRTVTYTNKHIVNFFHHRVATPVTFSPVFLQQTGYWSVADTSAKVFQSWTWVQFSWPDPTQPDPTHKWSEPTRFDSKSTWDSGVDPIQPEPFRTTFSCRLFFTMISTTYGRKSDQKPKWNK